ncbi:MAG: hypothetical protein P4L70_10930, partial [Parasulfuritortus sp.]|nr:hypothetical protein [Parasulfuritortus sp.]
DGRFRTLEVKGVEIRTPPEADVASAVARLLAIEDKLAATLARHDLGLGIAGFNPVTPAYDFKPPLNPWENELRQSHHAYDAPQVTNLSFGPDINLSMPGWDATRCLDAARKLEWYAPFLVPFSFSSPFFAGQVWPGWSKRTHERAHLRPTTKLYYPAMQAPASPLVYPPRHPGETGRIEFKAFDAMPDLEVLTACCHLLEGVCLAHDLPGRGRPPDLGLYRRAARQAFDDERIRAGSAKVLDRAIAALGRAGDTQGVLALNVLVELLEQRRTPAHRLLEDHRKTGLMYKAGGHRSANPISSPEQPHIGETLGVQ